MSANEPAASFSGAAKAVLIDAGTGFSRFPPDVLVASWRVFIESCEKGYALNEAEFDNDRDVRGAIEVLLEHDALRVYPEWEPWAREIADLDARYRAIVIPIPRHGGPWWKSTIPRFAGHELVEEALLFYGLRLEER